MRRLFLLLLSCVWLSTVQGAEESGKQALQPGTALVYLQGTYPLRTPMPLFGPAPLTRSEGRAQLQRAFDSGRQQVVIDCSRGLGLSAACAEAFAALIRSNDSDERTVSCLIDNASDTTMILAAACDEVLCMKAGFNQIDGVALYMDYYADALKKVGIQFHAVTSGAQKTGPEFLTRNEPSDAAIAEAQKLMNGVDQNIQQQSVRTGLSVEDLQAARELSPQTNEEMLSSGLADRVVEVLAWRSELPQPVQVIKRESNVPDLSSFAGMMKFYAQLMSGPRDRKPAAYLAVLELEGAIMDGSSDDPASIATRKTVKVLRDLTDDDRARAVLIRINSGGGSATASDRIYHAIKGLAAKKPCAVLIDDVAASGGYYIACGAQRIFAHRSSITGSIGVFAFMPDISAMRSMLGVHRKVLSSSGRATLMDTGAFDEDKRAALLSIIEDIDRRFQGIVASERALSGDAVAALADGKVYMAGEALELGLIDELGGCETALAWLQQQAGDGELPTQRFPEQQGLAEMLGLGLGSSWMPATMRVLVRMARAQRLQVCCWRQLPLIE